jgi:RNA polymerase sigma-70 factor (ECF subfamily)
MKTTPFPTPADTRPDRPDPVHSQHIQNHLGALLASVYARESSELDATTRFADLLAKLDAALGQARDGGEVEFRQLLLTATSALRRFALSLTHDPAAADDLVQDTLLRAWKNRKHFALGTNFDAWSFTIMRNQFYTDRRKHREVQDEEGAYTARLISLPDQGGCLDLRDVQAALAQLKPLMREALILVTVEGLTYENAAAVLGCQIGTVKSRVSRAREQLVHMLGYVGGEVGNDAVMLSASSQTTTS